jgi:hypothetical protein
MFFKLLLYSKGYSNEAEIDSYDGVLLGKYRYDNTSNAIIQFFNVEVRKREREREV